MTEPTSIAANAINAHGIDLLQKIGKPGENALISPYSIQNALVMTYAGAEGDTRIEMAKVLHYPKEDAELHQSFAALQKAIGDVMKKSTVDAEQTKKRGGKKDPIALIVANRLFGQKRHDFRAPFLSLLNNNYGAPLEPADFANNSADATKQINDWVADQTRQRICNLIPDGALGELTRLVLVNTIYLKAPWEAEFRESETKPLPFHTGGGESVEVPTMTGRRYVSYSRRNGFSVLALPYYGEDIQFLVLLPDQLNGLAQLERELTSSLLDTCANEQKQMVVLHLPKFKLTPPLLQLAGELQSMGMRNAFDQPRGSANFDRMAPRRPADYLFISAVFHRTFLSLDEKGTEAAAATAVATRAAGVSFDRTKPVEVRVDHPFLFAIQHRQSGTCLFLGHVKDPR